MNNKLKVDNEEIRNLQYKNSESGFAHYPHNEDMLQYEYLREGNPAGIAESAKMFEPAKQGHLSDDPVRNIKYLFIINTGLASRFAVEGGLDIETAYAISDLYIQKVDHLYNIDEIKILQQEMFAHYTQQVAASKREHVFSKPVVQCMEYIELHLTELVSLSGAAVYVGLNMNYLSTLFKKETGLSFHTYLINKRIEAAKNLLKHTEFSYSQISSGLAFSTQSHFTKVFREKTGYTPMKYRMMFYRQSISKD